MRFWYIGIVWCLIPVQQGGNCHDLGKSQASSYFYLKQNGGYEYGFNTDTGLQSAQTADQSNEVSGYYMYYDKDVPYMVKYRAGKDGFQPEIVPADKLITGNYEQAKPQNFKTPDNSWNIRRSPLRDNNASNYRLSQNQLQSPKVSSFSIGQDETFNFVQKALKTMQTQPMHVSFTSELGEIQHANGLYTTTLRPPTIVEAQPPPVTSNEVQDINNLAALPSSNTESKHPYSFNYNADQSARSETADPLGNVVGRYSYYDEAGYHDMSYKASDDTGFVVLGGNLASHQQPVQFPTVYSTQQHPHQLPQHRQLFRNNNFNFNNYRILPDSHVASNSLHERNLGKRSVRTATTLDQRNIGKRSLRKFRRYAKW